MDTVAMSLNGISAADIKQGMCLAETNSMQARSQFWCEVYIPRTSEGRVG